MKKELKDMTFVLTGGKKPLSTMIGTRHTKHNSLLYFDEGKGQNRELRYARNQKSCFVDEQDGNAVIEPIIFEDGILFAPKENPVLQQFMTLHPKFDKKFEILDNSVDAQDSLDKMDLEDQAIEMYKLLTISQLETIARVELNLRTDKLSSPEVKRDVRLFAKRSPSAFMSSIEDPRMGDQDTATLCFTNSLLTIRNHGRDIWYNLQDRPKTKLVSFKKGEDKIEALSAYFLTDEGVPVCKMLELLLEDE